MSCAAASNLLLDKAVRLVGGTVEPNEAYGCRGEYGESGRRIVSRMIRCVLVSWEYLRPLRARRRDG
jgi:hypothetical protein